MTLRIDIISDIVCPWCAIGYYQLAGALKQTKIEADIHWLPFELNPDMERGGQELTEHIMEKYGSTPQQSATARTQIIEAADQAGYKITVHEGGRIYNTFDAHRLLSGVKNSDLQTPLKLALFDAYFQDGADVSDPDVLLDRAVSAGMGKAVAAEILDGEKYANEVRGLENIVKSQGINGVPAMIFDQKYLVTGAQGTPVYAQVLTEATKIEPIKRDA